MGSNGFRGNQWIPWILFDLRQLIQNCCLEARLHDQPSGGTATEKITGELCSTLDAWSTLEHGFHIVPPSSIWFTILDIFNRFLICMKSKKHVELFQLWTLNWTPKNAFQPVFFLQIWTLSDLPKRCRPPSSLSPCAVQEVVENEEFEGRENAGIFDASQRWGEWTWCLNYHFCRNHIQLFCLNWMTLKLVGVFFQFLKPGNMVITAIDKFIHYTYIYICVYIYIYKYNMSTYTYIYSYRFFFQIIFFCWRESQPGRLVKATMDNQHNDLGIGLQLLLGLLRFSPRGDVVILSLCTYIQRAVKADGFPFTFWLFFVHEK